MLLVSRTIQSFHVAATALSMVLLLVAPPAEAQKEDRHIVGSYYRELAESGSPDAQLTMGDMYANGNGVPQDLIEAYAWYYVAAQQGVEEALRPMNDILRAIPEANWDDAKRRAEEYERRFVPPKR